MIDPATSTRITLRPIANALPLGLLALATATLLVSGLQLRWLDPSQGRVVALALLGFVFPAQLVTSIFGFLARDVVAGTGMGILAGTWLSVGLATLTLPPGSTSRALALMLAIAAVAMLVPASGAATGKLVPAAVLATTAIRFAVTAGYEWTAADGWRVTAGVVGVVLAALAIYAALAMLLEDVQHRTVLPLLRRDGGASSVAGSLTDQVRRVEGEAGVREQL